MDWKEQKCIGRESNPGLAESVEMLDLEWQRPILPLNHQCYWMMSSCAVDVMKPCNLWLKSGAKLEWVHEDSDGTFRMLEPFVVQHRTIER